MARNDYRDRLEALRGDVPALADRALDQYRDAIEVLETGEERAADRIVREDETLNDWHLDIESECVELIALQQPVASDLRLIAASFKIVTDLERVGDIATNLAKYGKAANGNVFRDIDVRPIAELAGEMVADATDAYARSDTEDARAVAARDDELDDLCMEATEAVMRRLLETTPGDVEDGEWTIDGVGRALLTIRDIERVGDHAVNVCARTVYMVEHDDELLY